MQRLPSGFSVVVACRRRDSTGVVIELRIRGHLVTTPVIVYLSRKHMLKPHTIKPIIHQAISTSDCIQTLEALQNVMLRVLEDSPCAISPLLPRLAE